MNGIKVYLRIENFNRMLARRNLTRIELAKALGVSYTLMSMVTSGKRPISASLRKKIQDFLQLSEERFDEIFEIVEIKGKKYKEQLPAV